MSDLARVSLSLEASLLDQLEKLARDNGYQNRSEFIRDLVRERMARAEWEGGREVLGTLTVIYNHHQRGLTEKLVTLQHHWGGHVLAATHVHLSHEVCILGFLTEWIWLLLKWREMPKELYLSALGASVFQLIAYFGVFVIVEAWASC